MPKIKTHRGYKKRVKVTKTGKIKRRRPGVSHFLEKRTQKRKRKLKVAEDIHASDRKRIRRALAI